MYGKMYFSRSMFKSRAAGRCILSGIEKREASAHDLSR